MNISGDGINGIGRPRQATPGQKTDNVKTGKSDFSDKLKTAASGAPEPPASEATERSQKIAELKAKVENGSYNPDMRDVARSLVKFITEGDA